MLRGRLQHRNQVALVLEEAIQLKLGCQTFYHFPREVSLLPARRKSPVLLKQFQKVPMVKTL